MRRLSLCQFLLLALGMLFSGCYEKDKKCTAYIACQPGITGSYGVENQIIGYEAADVDTIFIVRYKPNGRFDTPIDTVTWTDMNIQLGRPLDTGVIHYLPIAFSGGSDTRLNDDAVILKSVGRVYHLTEIMAQGDAGQTVNYWCDDRPYCSRQVVSMKVDGVYRDVSNPAVPFVLYKIGAVVYREVLSGINAGPSRNSKSSMNSDLNKSIEQIEGRVSREQEPSSPLVVMCYELRKKPLRDLDIEDLRLLIGQNMSLELLIPLALEKLKQNILSEGDYYPGDLFISVVGSDPEYWRGHRNHWTIVKELYQRHRELLESDNSFRQIRKSFEHFSQYHA